MSVIKHFSPGSWDMLPLDQNQIKIASCGLGYNDRKDAERFADPEMLHWLSKIETNPDCFYVHKIAMGGSHRYGPNRWGDGFREEVLARDCHTFNSAKAYRQHKSDGPYYGQVKLARLREHEGFVDLVTEYFGTPKVASQYGGQLADEEIESLQKHGYIPVSMGSLVPGDVCVICDHFAPKPKDRCSSFREGGECPLFGCKTGMLKMAADGRMNYVDNPKNRFYDISKVAVGADPIANGLLLPIGEFSVKAAEAAKLANFVYRDLDSDAASLHGAEQTAVQIAYYWASLEPKTADFEADDFDPGYASHQASVPDNIRLHSGDLQRRRDAVSSLRRSRCLPDFVSFAKSAGLPDHQIEAAKQHLPRIYSRLIRCGELLPVVKRAGISKIYGENRSDVFASAPVDGIDLTAVNRRALLMNAEMTKLQPRKLAAFTEALPSIVADYAAFKLAYFATSERINTAVLRGVVRRDLFDLEHKG